MAIHREDNRHLNNLQRNGTLAVKFLGAQTEYADGDIVLLGKLGRDTAVRKIFCLVNEPFPAGTVFSIGEVTIENNSSVQFAFWGNIRPDKRGIFHITVPASENFEGLGAAYTGPDPIQYSQTLRIGVRVDTAPSSDVGDMRIVIETDNVGNTQTGGYLA